MERLLVLFILITGCLAQDIVTPPENKALVRDGAVTLKCKIQQNDALTDYISWEECITLGDGTCRRISNDMDIVYAALGGDQAREDRYSITNPETKQFQLTVTGILPEDAGKYRCMARNDANVLKDAEVVILNDNPSCTRNSTNEVVHGTYVMMTCSVTYTGRWPPRFNWKVQGQQYTGVIVKETVNNNVQESIIVEAQPSHNGNVFSMDTDFAEPNDEGSNEAGNKPGYTDSHSFDMLTVFYAPYQISVSPDHGSYTPGDTVSCSAVANPPSSYVWTNTNTSEIISSSSTLTITESMLGNQQFMCRAYNTYGNDTATIDCNIYTPGGPDDPGDNTGGPAISTGAIAGICVAVLCVIIIIIIVIVCMSRRKKQLKEKQANETRPNPPKSGADVIRTPQPQPMNNTAPYPDEKVGHDTSDYDPYHAGPYDLEVPPYAEYDDVDERKNRNVENLTYADLALEDVPRSRKPIQIGVDMTDYAEIQRV